MIYENILQCIGNTPLIKLNKISETGSADIYAKYEGQNVGGSIKIRSSFAMINQAIKDGLLNEDSIIVEPTSGNQGIGLSLVGAVLGFKTIIIMPDSVSAERVKLCEQYGAEVRRIPDKGNIGECIQACIEEASSLKATNKNVFVPQQFCNYNNVLANIDGTGLEIVEEFKQSNLKIDGFCSGIGTGGSITGVGKALIKSFPECKIWALEPEKAAILSGKKIESHLQMGIGDGLIPEILDTEIIDNVLMITDKQAIEMSKRIASEEGILCGISSGTNVCGALELARKLGPGHNVVTLLPDTGERYLSTPLFD